MHILLLLLCTFATIRYFHLHSGSKVTNIPIILASNSSARARILHSIGANFTQKGTNFDERSVNAETPTQLALLLAQSKAFAVDDKDAKDSLIIGSDQVVHLNNKLLHQPGGADNAVEQLVSFSNQCVELVSAITLRFNQQTASAKVISKAYFNTISRDMAKRYVERDNPLYCAGAFKIEGAASLLMDRIESSDPNAIEGLPTTLLVPLTKQLGLSAEIWL